jgi:diguanylate cyclase (GGDEF)-like protein
MEEKLKWQVNHDHLTRLLNRQYFDEDLNREYLRLRRHPEEQSALFYIDLDRFKYINDTAGHSAGDQLLIEVGKLLSAQLRSNDMLARLGGDEFAVIARSVPAAQALAVAEQFRLALHRFTFVYQGKQYKVDGSIGVAVIDHTLKNAEEALVNADIACHIAKEKGRNQTHLFLLENDRRVAMDLDLGWSARLRDALEKNNLALHFQPILPLAALNLQRMPPYCEQGLMSKQAGMPAFTPSHYEVLVRVRGRDGTIIHPNAFLPTAERFGMMYEIDCWVIEHAFKQLARCQHKGHHPGLSLNLSGQSLADKNLSAYLQHLITRYAIDPTLLIFELTETSAIANIDSAKRLIKELSALGCKFALDDFGCGFSSFSHLKHLRVDYIKIDGMFIQGMVNDPIDQAMVRSMNDIAHSLGKRTIAEYVENLDQLNLLQHYGTDLVQGYYIGKPADHYLA